MNRQCRFGSPYLRIEVDDEREQGHPVELKPNTTTWVGRVVNEHCTTISRRGVQDGVQDGVVPGCLTGWVTFGLVLCVNLHAC